MALPRLENMGGSKLVGPINWSKPGMLEKLEETSPAVVLARLESARSALGILEIA